MFTENVAEATLTETPSRLIALVPCDLQNLSTFAQEIRWLAQKFGRAVLFLSLDDGREEGLAASRLLATLESITRDPSLAVSSVQVKARDWIDAVDKVTNSDDLVVCHETQAARLSPFNTIPLSDYLVQDRKLQVHVLTGFSYTRFARMRGWALNLLFWLGFLIIIAGFSFLEFQAQSLLSGAGEKIIFVALFLVEFGLIYGWTKITG